MFVSPVTSRCYSQNVYLTSCYCKLEMTCDHHLMYSSLGGDFVVVTTLITLGLDFAVVVTLITLGLDFVVVVTLIMYKQRQFYLKYKLH